MIKIPQPPLADLASDIAQARIPDMPSLGGVGLPFSAPKPPSLPGGVPVCVCQADLTNLLAAIPPITGLNSRLPLPIVPPSLSTLLRYTPMPVDLSLLRNLMKLDLPLPPFSPAGMASLNAMANVLGMIQALVGPLPMSEMMKVMADIAATLSNALAKVMKEIPSPSILSPLSQLAQAIQGLGLRPPFTPAGLSSLIGNPQLGSGLPGGNLNLIPPIPKLPMPPGLPIPDIRPPSIPSPPAAPTMGLPGGLSPSIPGVPSLGLPFAAPCGGMSFPLTPPSRPVLSKLSLAFAWLPFVSMGKMLNVNMSAPGCAAQLSANLAGLMGSGAAMRSLPRMTLPMQQLLGLLAGMASLNAAFGTTFPNMSALAQLRATLQSLYRLPFGRVPRFPLPLWPNIASLSPVLGLNLSELSRLSWRIPPASHIPMLRMGPLASLAFQLGNLGIGLRRGGSCRLGGACPARSLPWRR
ncbi:MAG: hypothetical protein AAF442_00650 [Pseudomonadota bacterium]